MLSRNNLYKNHHKSINIKWMDWTLVAVSRTRVFPVRHLIDLSFRCSMFDSKKYRARQRERREMSNWISRSIGRWICILRFGESHLLFLHWNVFRRAFFCNIVLWKSSFDIDSRLQCINCDRLLFCFCFLLIFLYVIVRRTRRKWNDTSEILPSTWDVGQTYYCEICKNCESTQLEFKFEWLRFRFAGEYVQKMTIWDRI